MKLKRALRQNLRFGFTLVELMIVVAIISVLAAIAIPTYSKYVKKSRTSEATGNLGAIAIYQETFFSENDTYVTVGPNPTSVPKPSAPGGRLKPSTAVAGWSLLGRVLPETAPLYFQYEAIAGAYDSGGGPVSGTVGSVTLMEDTVEPSKGGGDCDTVGNGTAPITAAELSIPDTASSSWFFATAVGDQDGDGKCSLFIKVIDRPDLVVEEEIE